MSDNQGPQDWIRAPVFQPQQPQQFQSQPPKSTKGRNVVIAVLVIAAVVIAGITVAALQGGGEASPVASLRKPSAHTIEVAAKLVGCNLAGAEAETEETRASMGVTRSDVCLSTDYGQIEFATFTDAAKLQTGVGLISLSSYWGINIDGETLGAFTEDERAKDLIVETMKVTKVAAPSNVLDTSSAAPTDEASQPTDDPSYYPTEDPSDPGTDTSETSDSEMIGSLDGTYFTWTDGLQAKVVSMISTPAGEYDDAAEDGQNMVVKIKFKNGTDQPVDLSMCTMSFTYGPDGDTGEVAYTEGVDDTCSGSVLPGKSKSFTFAYKVAQIDQTNVTIEVTPSWDYQTAFFQ